MTRITVAAWAPEYGTSLDGLEQSPALVDPAVELPAADWRPLGGDGPSASVVRFVDGVRRIDARLWVTGADGATRQGIAASFAAGVVVSDGAARIEAVAVRRGLFTPAGDVQPVRAAHCEYRPYSVAGDAGDELTAGLQQRMGALEARVAADCPAADLLVVDGPLHKVPLPPGAIGYVKSHQKTYLPPELGGVIEALGPGERTPLFVTTTSWSRYSWYLRLPLAKQPEHPWDGVVRCEANGDLTTAEASGLADLATATLPAYASTAYKDPRAPHNLFPIAGLERHLRHRLGDPRLLYRSLRSATRGG